MIEFNPQNHGRRVSGFTLIEILISVFILAGLILLVTSFSLDVSNFAGFFSESLGTQQEIQQTLRVLKTEVRSMGPAGNGSYAIESASAVSFIFFTDFDGDGLFERVRYYLEGNILKKGVIKPSGNPLAYLPADEKVSELVHYIIPSPPPIFTYYPKEVGTGGTPLTSPIDSSLIRLIKIDLTADENLQSPPGPANVSIFISIRNLRGI